MIIIKLGGSVITEKESYKKLRTKTLKRLIKELPEENFILVHGAGSFGHIVSSDRNLNSGLNGSNAIDFSIVARDVQELNTKIVSIMIENGMPAISMPIHSFHMVGENFPYTKFHEYLIRGFIPVTYGDVVLERKKGMEICSGDQIIFNLAKYLKPERVIFVSDVDGIYDKNPKINKDAVLLRTVHARDKLSFDNNVKDVTGGMELKFKIMGLLALSGIDVMILNGLVKNRLKMAIENKDVVSTRVVP